MVIATYCVATIPHNWHTIVRLRSSKVSDFNVIWKPVFYFLLVINSNLGPILHRLATIHPLQRTTDDDVDNRVRRLQHCCHLARFDSSRRSQHEGTTRAGPWRQQAAWRFDIAAPLGTSQWSTLGNAYLQQSVITSASAAETATVRKRNKYSSLSSTHDFFSSGTGNTSLDRWVSAPRSSWHKSEGVWPRWRQTPVKRRSYSSACQSPSNASTRHA